MYLSRSLALAGYLVFHRVVAWDIKPDYYNRNESECKDETRILRLRNNQELEQCYEFIVPRGQEGLDKCKKNLQETRKHICGDKDDILYCYVGNLICCFNNEPCAKDLHSITRWRDILLQARSNGKKKDKCLGATTEIH